MQFEHAHLCQSCQRLACRDGDVWLGLAGLFVRHLNCFNPRRKHGAGVRLEEAWLRRAFGAAHQRYTNGRLVICGKDVIGDLPVVVGELLLSEPRLLIKNFVWMRETNRGMLSSISG